MNYKSLVLASLIILSTFVVVAAASMPTMEFSGLDIASEVLSIKYKSGFYVWE